MSQKIATPYDEITYKIIGCAMKLHRELGPGHRENIYQKGLEACFEEAHFSFEPQKLYEVYDDQQKAHLIGFYIPDFVVEQKVIAEIKALNGLDNSHVAQVIGYLAISGCPVGLLLNFGERSLRYKRILPPTNITEHQVNRQWLFVPDWLRDQNEGLLKK